MPCTKQWEEVHCKLSHARKACCAFFCALNSFERDSFQYSVKCVQYCADMLSVVYQIPILTKENYFRKYTIPHRCWDGDLSSIDFVHCSSGSSGRPQLWSRNAGDEITVTGTFELVFHDSFKAHTKRTLVMVCFPLGSWVGGIFTTKCLSYLVHKVWCSPP